ncbi:hypothetical protein F2Q70_00000085 [Brassica cretica]|uniref:Uncharacterized protein n=2 Tax=Brassica cretica TaxID=69181 RepID=A0A3N6PTY5_BRACR|nr:hypothetical protein F2Q68_00018584 [Brassica cretica]KAF2575406.1 hypothetical protein F2Q70_00000085 [Brassica cretica]KAF3561370.1 hypothetical protein DY000_02010830 [Brassica cretica]
MNATVGYVMMMFLILIPSPLYASESSKASPTSSSLECSPCDHGKETSSKYERKNPIKGSIYFLHASLSEVNNSTKNLLIQCLTAYLKSSNLHVESVSIRNATTYVSFQNLKVDISVFPLGKENFTQQELDVVSFDLGKELYKAPAILGSYYFMSDMYIYFHDAMIIKSSIKWLCSFADVLDCCYCVRVKEEGDSSERSKGA